MARRGSLDSMFSDLLQEANIWAKKDRIGSGTIRMTHVNGRRLEGSKWGRTFAAPKTKGNLDKDDYAIEACLEQLARAISAHVTDILIDRLGIEERIAQRNDSETIRERIKATSSALHSPTYDMNSLRLQQSSSRTLSTPRSLPQSPTLRPRSRLPRPMTSSATRQTQPQPQSQYDRKCLRVRGDGTLLRYHSENRLNRIEPPPDNNETPLENRASRLRRATVGKKLADREQ
nr:unnamed protein product [Haemonchus contortus]